MSILKHVKVEGLWDKNPIEVDFDQQVNFLIGINGSGKTTLLNLIASALGADFEGLARSPFGAIECNLYSPKSDSQIDVFVHRTTVEPPVQAFRYTIRVAGKADQGFTLVSPSPHYYMSASVRRRLGDATIYGGDDDDTPLEKLVRVKWLSVHRTPSKTRSDDRAGSEPSVDRRLTALSNQLVRYFSKLAALRELETTRFLKQMLSAMVYNVSDFNPLAAAKELDLPALQSSIEVLLDTFLGGADAEKARGQIESSL